MINVLLMTDASGSAKSGYRHPAQRLKYPICNEPLTAIPFKTPVNSRVKPLNGAKYRNR